LKKNSLKDIQWSPNEANVFASCSVDKSIRIWDLSMGRCYRKIYDAHDKFVSCIDMKAKLVATGSVDTSVKIWTCR
jgi:ribosome assembly protein RRB1